MHRIESLEARALFNGGTVVDAFGGSNSGTSTVQINNHTYATQKTDFAVDAAGRSILAGFYTDHQQISLIRVDSDGTRDFTFGSPSGFAVLPLANSDTFYQARTFQITTDHANRVLVLADNVLTRLTSKGRIDKTFGSNGSETLPVFSQAVDLSVDARNRPIIVGTSQGTTGRRGTVIRLGVAGALDRSFGSNGAFKTPVPADLTYKVAGNATGVALKILDNGQIVSAAHVVYRYSAEQNAYIDGTESFRLNADGSLDTKYGTAGYTLVKVRENDVTNANATFRAFLSTGVELVSRTVASADSPEPESNTDYAYVDASGVLNSHSFNLIPSNLSPQPADGSVSVAGTQSDGKLLVTSNSSVYRLTSGLKLDSTFSPTPLASSNVFTNGLGDLLLFNPLRSGGVVVGSTFSITEVTA